jgi:chemotaxis protein MotA
VEIATPLGIILSIVMIAVAFILEGGSPMVAFSNPAAIIIIIGGTVGVGMASNKMSDIGPGFKATMKMMLPGNKLDGAAAVNELMEYADIARRDGLLALEEKAKAVEDPFMKRGLELVIDGTDSDEVAEVLEADIAAMKERHKVAAKFHMDCGAYAPAIGIVGCVLGLTLALSHMDDPGAMGHAISAAFIATLWGIGIANCFFMPLGNKMKRTSATEVLHRQMIIEGILAIQAGVAPRADGDEVSTAWSMVTPPSSRRPPRAPWAAGGS